MANTVVTKKINKYGKAILRKNVLISDKRYLFIVSHMRSRSTLLSHILGSHSDICGYRELHLSYLNSLSKLKMRVALSEEEGYQNSHILLDKLLHDKLNIETNTFDGNLAIIILLREPVSSLASMFSMHERLHGNSDYEHLLEYYIRRLTYIDEFVENRTHKFLYVDSDNLIERQKEELTKIATYLNLDSPLLESYKKFSKTGNEGVGDSSKNIMAGKIINTKKDNYNIDMSSEKYKALLQQHAELSEKLIKYGDIVK